MHEHSFHQSSFTVFIMESRKASLFWWVLIFFLTISLCGVKALSEEHHGKAHEGHVVERGLRRTLLVTEYGEILAIDVKLGHKQLPYHLQFFTLEPNSLFLPVILHADMVFYVHTGSGKLTWAHEGGTSTIQLRQGDLCSLSEGSVFYIQSNLEAERRKLRIYAMFSNTDDNTYDSSIGAYSRINELVRGFDKKIMQAALKVPEDLIEAITNKTETPGIVHAVSEKPNTVWEMEASFLKNFIRVGSNSKKLKTYNIFDNDPDFKNRNGWSIAVTKKQLKTLKRNNIGFFMVNLTMGSIMGPHWNPRATEVAVGLEGEGMVRVVCGSSNDAERGCQNMRFKVKQGDVFVVPRFHPMAQMSFEDAPFVFLGFSTAAKNNHPQFLAGKGSVLQILDKQVVATSFGVSGRTVDQLLSSPDDSIIFGCDSCAEEEEMMMKEEEEKEKREEEERKRKEEEATKKKEEKEEEEARKKEERKREEEEARKQQEERERKREEEEARREKEEERQQEEARRKKEKKREEEAEKEQEEARREQEKREKKREEEEAEREREEEEARRKKEEEKEQEAEREEEEARREKEIKRREEEEARRKKEEARRQKEERERKRAEEEARREQERKRAKEAEREEEAEKEQEQAEKQQEQRERRREEEDEEKEAERRKRPHKREKGEEDAKWEEETARRQQEEREKRRERESDNNKFMERGVEGQTRFDGRRVLKIRKV
ncbi:vicilin-like seed storage protein At2g18540 [Abrus precatorius]|uniref:Vicilin-like seed storage protein At2g18540 n=1 Tax=Abrus precatorius TaxID=3816 RepID=A0A8B8M2B2_ABRPR|nr:vicilin-like seed storage protein At2g18540 [Abrus precatorius]